VVTPIADERRIRPALEITKADFIQSQVNSAPLRSDGLAKAKDKIVPTHHDETETSPWLELTRWPEYIRGHKFSKIASLAFLPNPATEAILVAVEHSIRRLNSIEATLLRSDSASVRLCVCVHL
jgi:hypothetical protein